MLFRGAAAALLLLKGTLASVPPIEIKVGAPAAPVQGVCVLIAVPFRAPNSSIPTTEPSCKHESSLRSNT